MNEAPIRSFTELEAWKKARAVRQTIRVLVRTWPAEEKFRLVDQIVRASRGPCSNIAEGFGRFNEKDNARFCRMAAGSLFEVQDHLSAAFDEEYIDASALRQHWAIVDEALRVLNGYIRYLKRFERGAGVQEPAASYGTQPDIFGPVPVDVPGELPTPEGDHQGA